MLAVTAWLHRQPLMDMVAIGVRDEEQSHIFLAPFIAAWLLWLRRTRLRHVMVQPSLIGPVVAAIGWIVSWWGFEYGYQIAWHSGALMSLLGVVLAFTGLTPLYLFAPVFVCALFVLPVPGEIRQKLTLPLQDLATTVTHATLEFIGIVAIKSGNMLVVNGERVAIGEACNGMRMVFALSLVVYAFAFSTPLRQGTRLLLVLLSPGLAIVCNVIRLVPTAIIFGHGGNMDVAQSFHDMAGWIMLPIALLMLMAILRTIRWLDFPVAQMRLAGQ